MVDALRAARRLRAEADVVRVRAYALLDAGDSEAYDALCSRESRLVRASGWAALDPTQGARLLEEHGIDLPEREEPTKPAKLGARPKEGT